MSKTKKPAKNVAVVFGPGQISAKMSQAMSNYMKSHHAKRVAATKAKEAEEKALAAKTKGIRVKDLRKAITLGLSFKEAAYVGLKAVEDLEIFEHGLREGPDLDWMEEFIRHLFKKNDHTLQFKAEDDESEGFVNWFVKLKPPEEGVNFSLSYLVTEMDNPESYSLDDADILNQFILDFYGIKRHEVDPIRRAEEIKREISRLEEEIKMATEEIKGMKKELASLSPEKSV